MKNKMITSLFLTIFFFLHLAANDSTLRIQRPQNSNPLLKKMLESHVKPAIAATSMGAGTYLIYDAIKTTVDMQSVSQRNTQKAITLNALLGASLVAAGIWFFNHNWNEKEEKQTDVPKN